MTRQLRPAPHCLNCGHQMQSRFCPECGQENTNYKVSLGRLLGDLFEELFQLESRLWRSLWTLFRRPGRLTREYVAGRRVTYTSPLRLYLLASVTYFLAVAYVVPREDDRMVIKAELHDKNVDIDHLPPPKNFIEKRVRERFGILEKLEPHAAAQRIRETLVTNTPRVMALLVPIFALLVMMLFWRHFFVEHLVFALHAHALTFLLLTLSRLTRQSIADLVAILLSVAWTFVALRRVYEQSWWKVAWKGALLSFLYMIAVTCGILVALLGGILF